MAAVQNNRNNESGIQRDQLLTIEDLMVFKEDLLVEIKKIVTQNQDHSHKKWLRSSEVRKLLSISPGTLQNLRIKGTLPFTKISGVFYYSAEELEKMMSKKR